MRSCGRADADLVVHPEEDEPPHPCWTHPAWRVFQRGQNVFIRAGRSGESARWLEMTVHGTMW